MTTTYSVQVDLADDGSFVTVGDTLTATVLDISWELGMVKAFDCMCGESSMRVTFQNIARTYSPEVTSGLKTGKQIRIVSDNGTARVMWLGFIDEVRPSSGLSRRITIVTARGWDRELQNNVVRLPVAFNKRADELVASVLNASKLRLQGLSRYLITDTAGSLADVGWAAPDSAATLTAEAGKSTFPYSGEEWGDGVNAWEALRQVVESERGRLFLDRNGQPQFYNRHHLFADTVVDATIAGVMREVEYWHGVMSNWLRLRYRPRIPAGSLSVLGSHATSIRLGYGVTKRITVQFRDALNQPMGAQSIQPLLAGTDYTVNTATDGTGTNVTWAGFADIVEQSLSAVVIQLTNIKPFDVYVRGLQVRGVAVTILPDVVTELQSNASVTNYGLRRDEIDVPFFSTDEQAQDVAAFELARRSSITGRMRRMTLDRRTHEAQVMQRTLFDRISVSDTQTGHTGQYWIIGEAHQVTAIEHIAKYILEPATTNAFLADISLADGPDVAVY